MPEEHQIAGQPRGEPRPAGHVGARVRVPLSGTPSSRWSDALRARLTAALSGHEAVGHLSLNHLVQGAEVVLDGVEEREAAPLGVALREAVDGANRLLAGRGDDDRAPCNMPRQRATAIAAQMRVPEPAPEPALPI